MFDRGNYQTFSNELAQTDWQSLKCDNVDIYAETITEKIIALTDKHIPNRSIKLPSRKLLPIKVTPDLHLPYSKNGENLGCVLKMKNIACLSILLTKHVKYTYLYLFKFVLYSIVAFKAN